MTALPPHLEPHRQRYEALLAKLTKENPNEKPDNLTYFARRLLEDELGIVSSMIDPSRRPPPVVPDEPPRAPIANDDEDGDTDEDTEEDIAGSDESDRVVPIRSTPDDLGPLGPNRSSSDPETTYRVLAMHACPLCGSSHVIRKKRKSRRARP